MGYNTTGTFINVLWCAEFADASWVELKLNQYLAHANEDKEFFRLTYEEAKAVITATYNEECGILQHLERDLLLHSSYDEWSNYLDVVALLDYC